MENVGEHAALQLPGGAIRWSRCLLLLRYPTGWTQRVVGRSRHRPRLQFRGDGLSFRPLVLPFHGQPHQPSGDIKTTTAAVGVGYWFGPNRRPVGKEPAKGDAVDAQYVTEPQFTVFGGQSVVNTLLSQKALAGAAEYRQGFMPHLDGTPSFIYEGDPKITRRSGVALQVWPVNTFFDESTSVGIGVGPYIFIDRNHPVSSGQTVSVGMRNPAAVASLVSLTIARQPANHWIARIIWDRVVSNYNRDSGIFLVGLGCRWR